MNVAVLEKVKNHIIEHPELFNMMFFESDGVRCILGWVIELGECPPELKVQFEVGGPIRQASYILGVSVDDCVKLGYTHGWPDSFYSAYYNVDGLTETMQRLRARIVAERIDHFIKTGE